VDTEGITILLTTHLEHAELKRDQIRAFGPDPHIDRASPPMTVTLEPA
jgi:ATP-dependent Clp protease adaptor protein ClpS